MVDKLDPQSLTEKGKKLFASHKYTEAVRFFSEAVSAYEALGDVLNAAEARNNQSVCMLKSKNAQGALEALEGTEEVFRQAGDVERQAMTIGNQAAALEALKRIDEAVTAYEASARLFAEIGSGDMEAAVLQAAAELNLRKGKLMDYSISKLGSLSSVENPSFLDRVLKFFVKLFVR
ncbi:MAG: hypothetical protein JXA13_05215 [Anaerolineales bacterium]|nr:hypothetical protein [Anaerolineales bacterium]